MLRKLAFLFLLFFTGNLFATENPPQNNQYQYFVDLVNVENDQVRVTLVAPQLDQSTVQFHLPKIIPGTYTEYDFGRFVSGLQAFDVKGKQLPVDRLNINSWQIDNAQALYKLSYRVDDTFDATSGKPVSGMSGTNIEAGKNFILNGHGFFGYFEDLKFQEFKLTIEKPESFTGASAYTHVQKQDDRDIYLAPDYHYLVDMPIMYNEPDISSVKLGDTEVLISVYSPSGNVTSDFLAEEFEILLKSQRDYMGGELPVQQYAFLLYFLQDGMSVGTGALEHNYSSLYCLPDYPQEQIAPMLVDIAAHEFFHIITPLNIHSEEIHFFNFNDPEMSRHLWLYEGVTEYFAHHNQVQSGLISQEDFLQRMGQKIQSSQTLYDDRLPFTKLSTHCLDKTADEYGNVYQKGALIAMCLDLELLKLSNGEQGLMDVIQKLAEEFGSEQPFKDKKLFREFAEASYPEVKKFFKKYVDGKKPLPYAEYFKLAGISYHPPEPYMDFSLGNIALGFNSKTKRLKVMGTYEIDEVGRALGYQVGDEIIKINGVKLPQIPSQLGPAIRDIMQNLKEGEPLVIDIMRKDEQSEFQPLQLRTTTRKVQRMGAPKVKLSETANKAQLTIRDTWLR